MLAIHFLSLCLLSVSAIDLAFVPKEGPIEPCVISGQFVADNYSCTRYHVCRQVDGSNDFTTDIAICTDGRVFDMVTSECIDSGTKYLQDPAGCSSFYGCHQTEETSEGLLRNRFFCPGQLRFHPQEKYCTFKTKVTDDLCNSKLFSQRIVGDINQLITVNEFLLADNRNSGIGKVLPENSRITYYPPQTSHYSSSSYGSQDSPGIIVVAKKKNPEDIVKDVTRNSLKVSNKKPPGQSTLSTTNLNKIAQVISEQLLTRGGSRNMYASKH